MYTLSTQKLARTTLILILFTFRSSQRGWDNLPRPPVKGAPKFAKGGGRKGVIKKSLLYLIF